MRRTLAIAGAILGLGTPIAPAPAAADAPPGKGLGALPFSCNGEPVTVTLSQGAAHWVDGEHGVLTSLTITFTPTGGEPRTLFSNTWGTRTGLADERLTCSATFVRPDGTLTIDGTSVGVP